MKVQTIVPFNGTVFRKLQTHVREVRRLFDAPGNPYHDANEPADGMKFNRWCWHNPPVGVELHHSPRFIALASKIFGEPVKPSYCFLSMYGPDGVCPRHTDRPQCRFTIDLMVHGTWPIHIDEVEYPMGEGQALCYSGTDQPHYRKPMREDPKAGLSADLIFFHFVPVTYMGKLD